MPELLPLFALALFLLFAFRSSMASFREKDLDATAEVSLGQDDEFTMFAGVGSLILAALSVLCLALVVGRILHILSHIPV